MVGYYIFILNMDMESDRKNTEKWIEIHPYDIYIKIGYEYGYSY